MPIYTVGHSNHTSEAFVTLLRTHGVTALADVRSAPYSRFNLQFNRETLARALEAQGIRYVFLGRELGARPDDPGCYEEGRVRYARLARTALFRRGLDRVADGAHRHRLARADVVDRAACGSPPRRDRSPARRTGYGNPQAVKTTRARLARGLEEPHRIRQPAGGQNDTDMFIEIVRGAPSQAAFSTIAARYEVSKRLFATSDTCAAPKRSVSDSTEKVR